MTERIKTETLVLRRGDEVATVVTDGNKTVAYTQCGRKFYRSLLTALCALETAGYAISPAEGWD